ncbi:MAG: N-acetyltransferase [Bacteroidales bacterium]|jgi:predicted GNAT family acetyltransferase|nr:N-acetyltransferase [Bacteroidales bacterium]
MIVNNNVKIEMSHDNKRGIFELFVADEIAAEMTFVFAGEDKIIIDHTGVKEEYEGNGYGKALVKQGVEYARENKLKIIPLCPFAKKEFSKTPNYNDVLA